MVANALTRGAFNANLYEFATGRQDTRSGAMYNPNYTDTFISLPEMLGFDGQTRKTSFLNPVTGAVSYGVAGGAKGTMGIPTQQIINNIKTNAFTTGVSLVTIPIGFKIARRVLTKSGMTRAVNKSMKFIGLNEVRA